ncbi:MAG: hypothetical protein DMG32_06790 [Acidobacteria bacterium]|nr:MAG: hypothetical protein DMG32_06790 [Acidobacteriota bacterium]
MEPCLHCSGAVGLALIGATPSGTDMQMPGKVPVTLFAPLFLAVVALVTPAKAQQRLDGNYECVRLELEGQSALCQSPPLVLNHDGSYDIWGEHGTYEVVQGRWLVLSHSKRRGLGHFVNPHEIVFEYHVGKRLCRVTFQRIFEAPPGFWWG